MAAPNFEMVTELQVTTRRDFPVADQSLLNPLASNPIVDGEWLEIDGNYMLARGSGSGILPVYPVFTERGRYDTQSIGKVDVLFGGMYEAETTVFSSGVNALGMEVKVGDVANWMGTGLTKRGLVPAAGTSGEIVVGFVTKVAPTNGKVRFQHMTNKKVA